MLFKISVYLMIFLFFLFLPVEADWTDDVTSPVCTVNPTPGSYQPVGANSITSIIITATDQYGIFSLTVTGATLPESTIINTLNTSTSQTKTYSWTPALTTGTYTLNIDAEDGNGNTCSLPATFVIGPTITSWIQATGDVHANTRINATGGPSPRPGVSCPLQRTDPRVKNGLISAPSINDNFGNEGGQCVISNQAAFAPYKIPSYEDLKSLYYTQSKATKITVNHPPDPANQGTLRTALDNYDVVLINGDLDIRADLGGTTKTAVVFVEGDLNLNSTTFMFGDENTGIAFVVKGDVNIAASVTRIDAVIISSGTIYTAGADCSLADSLGDDEQLVINGSLISLEQGSITFCRKLDDNQNPAEKIINQPKYLVILRDLFSDTYQEWEEIL